MAAGSSIGTTAPAATADTPAAAWGRACVTPIWLYGNRDDQIYDSIAQGRSKGMPAWGTKIPEQQIWELVAYIKSMGTPQEPDPPVEPTEEEVPNPREQHCAWHGTQDAQ